MKHLVRYLTISAALLTVVSLQEAKADTILTYTLTQDGCTGTCGTSPYGTVSLSDNLAGMVTVTLTLKPGETFANTGAGEALEYQLANPNAAGLSINVLTAGFTAGGPATASTFGSFNKSIICSICANGGNINNPTGPLVFTVTDTAKDISLASFVANAQGYFFASDILGTNGNTGNVAALGPGGGGGGGAVPEPSSWWLLTSALAMIEAGRMARRRV